MILICSFVWAMKRLSVWVHNFRFNFDQKILCISFFRSTVFSSDFLLNSLRFDDGIQPDPAIKFQFWIFENSNEIVSFFCSISTKFRWINNGKRLFVAFLKIDHFTHTQRPVIAFLTVIGYTYLSGLYGARNRVRPP